MKCDNIFMRLYAVTDRAWTGEQSLLQQVEEALRGGVSCVQLREKMLGNGDFLAEALEMKQLCHRYGVPLFINDNVEIALACGADGVHVGQSDGSPAEIRKKIGAGRMLGVSAQTVAQALAAEQAGADCLGVGAVFATSTKLDAAPVRHEVVRAICEAVSIPVVAIGGIYKHNILQLSGTGVDGVAMVSGIFGAKDITGECRALRQLADEMVGK